MNLPTLDEMCISEEVQNKYAKDVAINDIIEEIYGEEIIVQKRL